MKSVIFGTLRKPWAVILRGCSGELEYKAQSSQWSTVKVLMTTQKHWWLWFHVVWWGQDRSAWASIRDCESSKDHEEALSQNHKEYQRRIRGESEKLNPSRLYNTEWCICWFHQLPCWSTELWLWVCCLGLSRPDTALLKPVSPIWTVHYLRGLI